jgi:hypothetical protein
MLEVIVANLIPLTIAAIVLIIAIVTIVVIASYLLRKIGVGKVGIVDLNPDEPSESKATVESIKKEQDAQTNLKIVTLVDLKVKSAMLPFEGKDECRSIVRDASTQTIDLLRRITRDKVCHMLGGCLTEEPEELRDYRLISEAAEQRMIAEIMKTVERNHFADQSILEWAQTKEIVFRQTWAVVESYYEERYFSSRIPVSALREENHKRIDEFLAIYEPMMERCRVVSQRIKAKQEELDAQGTSLFTIEL